MVSENFDIEFQSGFDELMKARRASVGEIRVHSNGVKYQNNLTVVGNHYLKMV